MRIVSWIWLRNLGALQPIASRVSMTCYWMTCCGYTFVMYIMFISYECQLQAPGICGCFPFVNNLHDFDVSMRFQAGAPSWGCVDGCLGWYALLPFSWMLSLGSNGTPFFLHCSFCCILVSCILIHGFTSYVRKTSPSCSAVSLNGSNTTLQWTLT